MRPGSAGQSSAGSLRKLGHATQATASRTEFFNRRRAANLCAYGERTNVTGATADATRGTSTPPHHEIELQEPRVPYCKTAPLFFRLAGIPLHDAGGPNLELKRRKVVLVLHIGEAGPAWSRA